MFTTNENYKSLNTFTNWLADRTFREVSKLFSQLYIDTIHGYENRTVILYLSIFS